jgi:hypothetical protein
MDQMSAIFSAFILAYGAAELPDRVAIVSSAQPRQHACRPYRRCTSFRTSRQPALIPAPFPVRAAGGQFPETLMVMTHRVAPRQTGTSRWLAVHAMAPYPGARRVAGAFIVGALLHVMELAACRVDTARRAGPPSRGGAGAIPVMIRLSTWVVTPRS